MNKIIHGDCLEVLKTLPDHSVDTVLTDPPYSILTQHHMTRNDKWRRKWSDVTILTHWWDCVTDELKRVLKPEGHIIVFCNADSYAAFYPPMFNKWDKLACLVWDKVYPGLGMIWRRQHELIIAGRNKRHYRSHTWCGSDILEHQIVSSQKRIHPAEKPVNLLADLLKAVTPPNGIVLDPFAGSGSTLAAAKQEGYSYIGVELEKEYYEGIDRRLKNEQRVSV